MLLAISAATLAAWLYLAFFRGFYWRADTRLEPAPAPSTWPEIVAIIPARNERETIAQVVAAHDATDYPGPFRVILVDDESADGTAEAAKTAAGSRRELTIVAAPPLAGGWSGKLAAMNAGLVAARNAAPEASYILFADADIAIGRTTLRRLVAKAEDENLAIVSLMSRLDSRGCWGGLLIPAFVYFFQKLYPFPWTNDPKRRTAAAAGGCMLVRRDALVAAGGLEPIRGALIDDCALAALIKGAGRPIWIGVAGADDAASLRDNRRLSSIWSMVARTAFAQLRRSRLLLAVTAVGMAVVYGGPPAIALSYPLHRDELAGAAALGAWILMAATYGPTVRLYGVHPLGAALLPVSATLYLLMTLSSALRHARGREGFWKGRYAPREA